jgi:hypothetical protein
VSNFIAQNLFLERFGNVWNGELGISSTGIAQNWSVHPGLIKIAI